MTAGPVTIVHAIPGRLRLKVAGIKSNPDLLTDVRQRLAAVPAVQDVEVNAGTGSVIIRYDAAALTTDDSLRTLVTSLASVFPDSDLSQIDLSTPLSANGTMAATTPVIATSIRTFFAKLNEHIDAATGGTADLKTLLPLLLFGFGIRSLFKTDKPHVPTWYDFLWFALGTYFMLNPRPEDKPQ
jgi:hypothetical protein